MSKDRKNNKQLHKIAKRILPMMEDMHAEGPEIPQDVLDRLQKEVSEVFAENAKSNGKLGAKGKTANVIAKTTHFLVDWRPFNLKPIRAVYNWAHKVRSNDPAWTEYMIKKETKKANKKTKSESNPILQPA